MSQKNGPSGAFNDDCRSKSRQKKPSKYGFRLIWGIVKNEKKNDILLLFYSLNRAEILVQNTIKGYSNTTTTWTATRTITTRNNNTP